MCQLPVRELAHKPADARTRYKRWRRLPRPVVPPLPLTTIRILRPLSQLPRASALQPTATLRGGPLNPIAVPPPRYPSYQSIHSHPPAVAHLHLHLLQIHTPSPTTSSFPTSCFTPPPPPPLLLPPTRPSSTEFVTCRACLPTTSTTPPPLRARAALLPHCAMSLRREPGPLAEIR